jgi:integral membrane protein (TIGR01906 family)
MKISHIIAGTVASIAIVLVLLSSAFDLAVYGDYGFFEKEYVKYEIQQDLPMEMEDIMEVTAHMMDYLRGREEDMQITTKVDGQIRDFFNEQDLFHMAEVKNLFLGMYAIRRIGVLVLAAAVLAMVMMKTGYERFYRVFQRVLIGFGALILVLGLLIWTQFDRVFIIFHHIVFDNSAWLFDPRTDLMINMLPEGLFMDFAVRILVVFALMLTAVEVGFVWIRKQIKKKMQV